MKNTIKYLVLNCCKKGFYFRNSVAISLFLFSFIATSRAQMNGAESIATGSNQEPCGFDQIHKNKLIDPVYKQIWEEHNAMMMREIVNPHVKTVAQIPVVVHVLHKGEAIGVGSNISDAQILSAINNLNAVWANTVGTMSSVDMGVQFQLALRDPNCNATTGINRVNASGVANYSADGLQVNGTGLGANETTLKDLSKWPTDKYMNFWIVSEIGGNNGQYGVQGYCNLPVGIDAYNGAVMMAGTFGYDLTGTLGYYFGPLGGGNSTVVHEVGHFFDLYHTFEGGGDGVCPSTETNCLTQNDFVCDTPPHMSYLTSNPTLYAGCPSGHANECAPGNMDQIFHNIMNYTTCPNHFTAGQKARVTACLATSRASLTTSSGLIASSGVYIEPIAAGCAAITTGIGLTNSYAGIIEVIFSDLSSGSAPTNIDNATNGYMDFTNSCLHVAHIEVGATYPLKVTTWYNTQKVKAWIDYNNNGVFTDTGEELTPAGGLTSTSGAQVTQNVVIPFSVVLNTSLRMRVISDRNSVSGPCHTSTYGQAEDYPVIITSNSAYVVIASSDADNSICSGTSVTFTATTINGGAAPAYQWKVNGVNAGTNSSIFTTTTLTTGQSVNCIMTSNLAGVSASPATSNTIVTIVDACVGIVEIDEAKYLIYPNPVNDVLTISSEKEPIKFIKLYDNSGRLILFKEMTGCQKEVMLSLTNYEQGIYFIQIGSESKIVNSKINKL